ncbi:MAG TPA: methyltransferase domain-containing protein [Steroidobacteraceae bacterium]|jgi:SAM-dependent methyltransferase
MPLSASQSPRPEAATPGLLGDTPARDYAHKLRRFNAFAAPELGQALASLKLRPGMRVLDAGCGTGEGLVGLARAVGHGGLALGLELSHAHLASARALLPSAVTILQADLLRPPLRAAQFDLVWAINTVNHLRDPIAGIRALSGLLKPGGRVALGQSALLPDLLLAWDARLERVTNEAVRAYYRDRYALSEQQLTGVRAIVGWLRAAGLLHVTVRTWPIERIAPLDGASEEYLREVIFGGTWGERLRPYLSDQDFQQLARLCDPQSPEYALRRTDLHVLQTFTLAIGELALS